MNKPIYIRKQNANFERLLERLERETGVVSSSDGHPGIAPFLSVSNEYAHIVYNIEGQEIHCEDDFVAEVKRRRPAMNEILFTALDVGGNRVYGIPVDSGIKGRKIMYTDNMEFHHAPVKPKTVGQYTGITAAESYRTGEHACKIFGDDLVIYDDDMGVMRVKYLGASWWLLGRKCNAALDDVYTCDIKIVGNIHEVQDD